MNLKQNMETRKKHSRKRIVTGWLFIIIGCLLVIWCIDRWDVWFYNTEELPYKAPEAPSRMLLTFGDADGKNRNVSWMCGEEVHPAALELVDDVDGGTSWVDAAGEVFESRGGKAAYYVARLRDLKTGHFYRYRAWTGDEVSKWHSFLVPDDSDVSFLYVGDIQDSIGGVTNSLLKAAFRCNPDVEFLVCGGDLTERPIDAYWEESFAGLDSVGQSVPVLTVTGNHDYLKGVICKLERRFSLIHSYFLDSMIGENQVFTVRRGDVQIFCLDSNREFPYLWTQRKWLEEQLEQSKAKWKIVVLHHPLYSIKSTTNNLIQRWMFDDLVRQYGVDIVLQGHEHAYARMTHHNAEDKAIPPIYTVSHCSPKSYHIQFSDAFDKFGVGSRYYQKVHTHRDTLFLTAYDATDGTLYDSLFVVKTATSTLLRDYGEDIPERLDFTPSPESSKDAAFAERIREYQEKKKKE